jgi:uncharacterized phage protein (TIGR01671 family)
MKRKLTTSDYKQQQTPHLRVGAVIGSPYIKFRAWDKSKRKMLEVAAIEFIDRMEGRTGANVFTDSNKRKERFWIEAKDLVLMQYSGFKDSAGIEIFEGDIIQIHIPAIVKADPEEGYLINSLIVFENGAFCVKEKNDNELLSNYIQDWQLKVIGNFYESTEPLGCL